MSFTYNGHPIAALGATATLTVLPSLSGMQVEAIETPGMESRAFAGVTRPRTRLVFDTIMHGSTPAETIDRVHALLAVLDPSAGPGRLILDFDPDWYWQAALAEQIEWERLTWDRALGFRLRSEVVFDTHGDAAARRIQEPAQAAPGLIETVGNTRAWPTIEIRGTLTANQTVAVTLGDFTVTVAGPLSEQERMLLDYDEMRFEVLRGPLKVASLVQRLSHLERAVLRPQLGPAPFTVEPVTGGEVTAATLIPNSRRQ